MKSHILLILEGIDVQVIKIDIVEIYIVLVAHGADMPYIEM